MYPVKIKISYQGRGRGNERSHDEGVHALFKSLRTVSALDFFGKLDEKGDDWLPVPFHDLTDSSTDF